MNEVVCATRGGEGSRAVQLAAIERAKRVGQPLVFLYVAAPGSIETENGALQEAVQEELIWLGKALLHVARHRARDSGLEAQTVILVGDVQDEICHYLTEHQASILLLGAPRGTTAELLGDDAVERFAARIMDNSGVAVQVIRPETIMDEDEL
jgi:nucleotide-binding universal stress UspA family protein